MPLHMIKLVVGCDDIEELARWYRTRAPIIHTRQTPKRAAEIVEGGGSIYRIIKGQILLRQKILAIDTIGEGGTSRCEIRLDPKFVLVAPTPRRAFQGWRYFTEDDAPADLGVGEGAEMPMELAAQLRALGAW
jgi:hypothetical protein